MQNENQDEREQQNNHSSQITSDVSDIARTIHKNSNSSSENTSDNSLKEPSSAASNSSNSPKSSPVGSGENIASQGGNAASAATSQGASSAAGAAGTGSTAGASAASAGGSATAGLATAGGSAAAGAAGAGGGAAAGAAAGSVVPIAGTAVGAAAGAAVGGTAKKAAEKAKDGAAKKASSHQKDAVEAKIKGKVDEKASQNKSVNDSAPTKLLLFLFATVFALIFLILIIISMLVTSVAAPVMYVFQMVCEGTESIGSFFDEIGKENPTYEEIALLFNNKIGESMEKAYSETCYNEVLQIAEEQEYDMDLTIESYNKTEFPYILEGDNCTVNYAELINVISMSEEYNNANEWKDFDYDEFFEIINDNEFRRTLYDLNVTPAAIVNPAVIPEGGAAIIESFEPESRTATVKLYDIEGNETIISGEASTGYIIVYGEVSVDHYPLKKIFDYLGVDPYAKSTYLPQRSNYASLDFQERFTRNYKNANWGYSGRTPLGNYEYLTGTITKEEMNIYAKDLIREDIIKEGEVHYDVTRFLQSDPEWGGKTFNLKEKVYSMKSAGCCVTSMAMVINYFYDSAFTPNDILASMKKYDGGTLVRATLARRYGFQEHVTNESNMNLERIVSELDNNRLIIAHIPKDGLITNNGHFVVISGYKKEGDDFIFYIVNPSRGKDVIANDTVTALNLITRFDYYSSYGK